MGGKGFRTGVSMSGRMPDGTKVTMDLGASVKLALTGWPTPRTPTGGAESAERKKELGRTESGGGDLQAVALTAGWPTPMAGTPAQKGYNEAGNTDSSRKTVELASGWATPRREDSESTGAHRGKADTLHSQTQLAGSPWATPAARDYRTANLKSFEDRGGGKKGEQLNNQVVHSGPTPNGSPAPTEKRGQLNPAFSRWLQGYPREWCEAAIRAYRSMPTRVRKRGPEG